MAAPAYEHSSVQFNVALRPEKPSGLLGTVKGARLLPQSYQYPKLSEGADRVGGQLCGDKECPFSGVTKSGRVRRKTRVGRLLLRRVGRLSFTTVVEKHR